MSHKLPNHKAQRILAGFSIGDLAKKAGVGDLTIKVVENGGAIDVGSSTRLANAMGVSLVTLGQVDV